MKEVFASKERRTRTGGVIMASAGRRRASSIWRRARLRASLTSIFLKEQKTGFKTTSAVVMCITSVGFASNDSVQVTSCVTNVGHQLYPAAPGYLMSPLPAISCNEPEL
jgi:hypothetical protein